MDLILRLEARFTDLIPIGLVPEGVRVDAHYSGPITAGPFTGGTVRGIDYLLFRSDGVGVLDVRELITTPSGGNISVRAHGYATLPGGMQFPPSELLVQPDFVWPDLAVPLHGVALCQTGTAEIAWLNRTALLFEGASNPGARTLSISASAFTPIRESPGLRS